MKKETAKIGIVYVDTNSRTAEKIGIGAVYLSDHKIRFKFSNAKIILVKRFIDNKAWHFLKDQIKQIRESLKTYKVSNNNGINTAYFDYLNNYSQGLIKFGELKPFFGPVDDQIIANFLENLVFIKRSEKVKEKIIPRNFKIRIKENVIPDSLIPITVDAAFIFRNNDSNELQVFKEIKTSSVRQFKSQLQTQLFSSKQMGQLLSTKPEKIKTTVVTNKEHLEMANEIISKLNIKNIKIIEGKEEFSKTVDALIKKGFRELSTERLHNKLA